MIPIEDIIKNYRTFDDATIQKIALNPKGLRKEIVDVLNDEIARRNLDLGLIEWVKVETDFYEGSEIERLTVDIKSTICTNCNLETELNGYRFNTIYSFIFGASTEVKHQIICAKCAHEKRLRSMFLTSICGWWSVHGLFATPISLISDLFLLNKPEKHSEEVINAFIEHNTGMLRRIEKRNGKLDSLIRRFNGIQQTDSEELFN
ncbi:hypothetical protein ACFOG5_20005 [Pedobacter fastidiosus]|uniref:Restriction endonuclease n=1 Tax=Pedobacter fastidiosus TaxID=2765361 RepID=A0ABR7KVV6_9SPHI|nr:hypothetical protein [Pedobacter fastidiosus]MBC6112249.1 hypothetical protein [Pedobacter fastidiosus]